MGGWVGSGLGGKRVLNGRDSWKTWFFGLPCSIAGDFVLLFKDHFTMLWVLVFGEVLPLFLTGKLPLDSLWFFESDTAALRAKSSYKGPFLSCAQTAQTCFLF